MPQAVTHILFPIIIIALIRDYYISKKSRRSFPLYYVFIAGLGGILPDIDYLVFALLRPLGFAFEEVHRTYTHSFIIPAVFFILYLLFINVKVRELGRHHLKLNIIFLMLSFGTLTHIILDMIIFGQVHPFLPFSSSPIGLDLLSSFPSPFNSTALLDGILLVIYLTYLELKHRISDFI